MENCEALNWLSSSSCLPWLAASDSPASWPLSLPLYICHLCNSEDGLIGWVFLGYTLEKDGTQWVDVTVSMSTEHVRFAKTPKDTRLHWELWLLSLSFFRSICKCLPLFLQTLAGSNTCSRFSGSWLHICFLDHVPVLIRALSSARLCGISMPPDSH